MNRVFGKFSGTVIALLLVLGGCGGGSGGGGDQTAGIGGTGKIASGTITGFGSIFVNGVEHDVSSSSISIDDNSGSESDLRVGMVVTVEGTVNGSTGIASSVIYDDALQGPVAGLSTDADGLSKRFTVLGITIVADSSGTVFDDGTAGFSFDNIADNDIVEISGYFDAAGILRATYIDKEGDFNVSAEVELKGIVADAGTGATAGDSFTLNGIDIDIALTADLSDVPGAVVVNGAFVEVEGSWDGARINADRVEQEDSSIGDDGDSVSLQGLVTGFTGDLSSFQVAGQTVDASSAQFEPTGLVLADGTKVEVEGVIVAGVLVADEVESRGGEIKLHATISDVSVSNVTTNAGIITLSAGSGTIPVTTNSKTAFEDETDIDTTPPLKLSELNVGNFVEINAYQDGNAVVATEVHRADVDDVIVQGPVDQTLGSTITILGLTFFTDIGTQYEDTDDSPLTGGATTFFGSDRTGSIVKIKDEVAADGTADEVDLES